MKKHVALVITVLLVIIHSIILYLWLVDWEKLVTPVGLVSWIGSMLLGVFISLLYVQKFRRLGKLYLVFGRILISSTSVTIILGILALLIEFVTRSMP